MSHVILITTAISVGINVKELGESAAEMFLKFYQGIKIEIEILS